MIGWQKKPLFNLNMFCVHSCKHAVKHMASLDPTPHDPGKINNSLFQIFDEKVFWPGAENSNPGLDV